MLLLDGITALPIIELELDMEYDFPRKIEIDISSESEIL